VGTELKTQRFIADRCLRRVGR